MDTDPGDLLRHGLADRYAVDEEVGRGGMARVYRAHDLRHNRSVAIKILHPELGLAVSERFHKEIEIEAQLQHPMILPLYDSGEVNGVLYYVMPFVEGDSLQDRIQRERQLPVDEAVRIARDVAEALSHAHSRGVVHRDIKPGNVLLSGEHALVADFGIARAISAAGGGRLTSAGITLGTPAYMSPEQAGADEIDGRSDLYALGCMLYEMLAGSPPFTGPTSQAVLARHLQELPSSIRTVRPNVPPWLDELVGALLEKVAADRPATAHDVVKSLDVGVSGQYRPTRPRRLWRRRILGGVALGGAVTVAGVVVAGLIGSSVPLDRNSVVVFPLREVGTPPGTGHGEEVATVVGYALEGTDPLRWLEGLQWLSPAEREDRAGVTYAKKVRISRARRSAYFIDGSIVAGSTSLGVHLRLHDVAGDSVVAQARTSGGGDLRLAGTLGVRAVTELLPVLVGSRNVDAMSSALADRDPAAIANWLQGERAYRRSDFRAALDHFDRALEHDSALALAALGAGKAASWLRQLRDAQRFLNVAIQHEELLPSRYGSLTHGLRNYFVGRADSALQYVRAALTLDPEWGEAWMVLGEVYNHLLPGTAQLDSVYRVLERPLDLDKRWYEAWMRFRENYRGLQPRAVRPGVGPASPAIVAEAALATAVEFDPDFTPPLGHLALYALQRGEVERAGRLLRRQIRDADPLWNLQVELILQCVRDGASAVTWRRVADSVPAAVLNAGVSTVKGMYRADCAESAFRAVLASDTADVSERWGALLGLQSVLMAQARYDEVAALLDSDAAAPLAGPRLFLLLAAAGGPFKERAEEVAVSLGTNYEVRTGPVLWLLGLWATHAGRADAVDRITTVLAGRADSAGTRRARLFADIMSGYAALTRGDTSAALEAFTALTPSAARDALLWQPWESLGPERLAVAEILLAREEYAGALAAATALDSSQPIVYPIYLPRSLDIRAGAAEGMGDRTLARHYKDRLAALRPQVTSR